MFLAKTRDSGSVSLWKFWGAEFWKRIQSLHRCVSTSSQFICWCVQMPVNKQWPPTTAVGYFLIQLRPQVRNPRNFKHVLSICKCRFASAEERRDTSTTIKKNGQTSSCLKKNFKKSKTFQVYWGKNDKPETPKETWYFCKTVTKGRKLWLQQNNFFLDVFFSALLHVTCCNTPKYGSKCQMCFLCVLCCLW